MFTCETCKHISLEGDKEPFMYKCLVHKLYKNKKDGCGKWEENVLTTPKTDLELAMSQKEFISK